MCLLLLWAFSVCFFFFFPLQFCNLNKSIEVYLTWSNQKCVLLWAVFLRNFLLQFCIHKSSLLCVKMRGRIIPYAPLTAVDFLCLCLKQLLSTMLLVLSVGVFWQRGPILQTRAHVCAWLQFSKEFICTVTWKCQRSVGWALFSNLVNSYWRAESAGPAVFMINFLWGFDTGLK